VIETIGVCAQRLMQAGECCNQGGKYFLMRAPLVDWLTAGCSFPLKRSGMVIMMRTRLAASQTIVH
jgi:hypothetical protein